MLTAKTSKNLSLTLPYQLTTPNHTQKSYLHDGQNQQFIEPNFVNHVLPQRFQFFQSFKNKNCDITQSVIRNIAGYSNLKR